MRVEVTKTHESMRFYQVKYQYKSLIYYAPA